MIGVLKLIDLYTIINLKRKGKSNREIARECGWDRKTVNKYWNHYSYKVRELGEENVDIKIIQEQMLEVKYDANNRSYRKYNEEMDRLLEEILENEKTKLKELGWKKQQLTNVQIHEMIASAGHEIGITTITEKVREKRKKHRECFIRQHYEYGQRLEYDFGEIKLEIQGKREKYHIAVLSSPKSNFRWAYLYKHQKKDVFLDSQVKFFDMVGGVYEEVVYDNMRNVVKKFIGKHEKELNKDLIKLSIYYDFDINVTNCFKGNEKGHVEGAVKFIRNKAFSMKYKFNSYEEARNYLQTRLVALNQGSMIEEEKCHLKPLKPSLRLSEVTECKINKYSLATIENNYYSVPEYLVGEIVTARIYFDTISLYVNNEFVCEHKKVDGFKTFQLDIMHYLNTFLKKPGALRNSHALKDRPELKLIYDTYYKTKPREFIELLQTNKNVEIDDLVTLLQDSKEPNIEKQLFNHYEETKLEKATRNQIYNYSKLIS